MSPARGWPLHAVMLSLLLATGCRGAARTALSYLHAPGAERRTAIARDADQADTPEESEVLTVSNQEEVSNESAAVPPDAAADLSNVESELSLDWLIAAVIERNPTMQAANAAWCAAAQRYPQVVALDDPMLQSMLAPATMTPGSSTQSSYYVGAAQKVPWRGKRSLRGQMALWETQAAAWDAQEVELRLANSTRLAYFDYYLVQRELELNSQNVEVLQDFRSAAKTKYEAGQVSQQDLTTADLELAKLQQQAVELQRQQRIAAARINTLLHQRPDCPLPPVKQLTTIDTLPAAESLLELAVKQRPEVSALAARVQSEQNAVLLACKEYYPDFEFMGRYDSFWTDTVQRPQVGMNMNIPLNQDRRAAAVREAQFRLHKLMAELASQEDAVREEVQVAHARLEATRQTVTLFQQKTLPAAEANLSEARAAYIAGAIDFLRLMEARRQSTDQQINYQRSLAELHRRQADLDRAVGFFNGGSPR